MSAAKEREEKRRRSQSTLARPINDSYESYQNAGSALGRSRSRTMLGEDQAPKVEMKRMRSVSFRALSSDALLINSTHTLTNSQYLGADRCGGDCSEPAEPQRPSRSNSSAVRSFNKSIRKQHYLHYKMFLGIFGIALVGIVFQAVYFYDIPPISNTVALSVGASIIQGLHQLSVMITTFIALAIPLTANFYTPRLYEVFLKDKVNIAFFILFSVFSTVSVFTDAFVFSTETVAWLPYCLLVASAVFGWAVVVPYYYYVMRFLDPEVIVDRVSSVVVREIFRTVNRKYPPALARKKLNESIIQLGDIGFRSVDRKDSGTTITTVRALCFALGIYREQKPFMHPKFFEVDVNEFPNLSKSGLNYLSHSSLWVEEQIMVQLHKAFTSAINRMPGVVSFIALAVREQCIPLMNSEEPDQQNLRLYIRFMNTFLREVINKHDVRGLFNVFYQYTSLAKDLSKWYPQEVPLLAKYMSYYMQLASAHGLDFGAQICIYDLENLTAYLYRTKNEHAEIVLKHLLAPKVAKLRGGMERRGAIHSRLILGSFLLYLERLLGRDYKEPLEHIAAALVPARRQEILHATDQILQVVDEMFWEITDRVVNFDYVPEQQRPYLSQFSKHVLTLKRKKAKQQRHRSSKRRDRDSDSSESSDDDSSTEPELDMSEEDSYLAEVLVGSYPGPAHTHLRRSRAQRRHDEEEELLEERKESEARRDARMRQSDTAQETSTVSGTMGMMIAS